MYILRIETDFAAAHNLRNYKGKCENLHGHNWKVAIEVSSEKLDNIGIVIDFSILKSIANSIITKLDHYYLNELPAFTEQNPSSENIAKYIYTKFKEKINLDYTSVKIEQVIIWESANYSASYRE